MKKTFTEDECVDSGAETAGSDYSPLSSNSSELSMGELQDPFLVSVHLITDPGQGKVLQRAADAVLAWVHPELQLFRVSERASQRPWPRGHQNGGPSAGSQPAMAVILFLQEAYGGEEQILALHRTLQRPPWHYHHTEKVSSGRSVLPLAPCSQDFFILSPGTPLWTVRQVHYGKEIVRFTVYCRHENYVDMVQLYKLLLQRRVAQKKEDFCFFVVYSNPDIEIQLSFKRLPHGLNPSMQDSAVMEVRVRDVGVLVPLLPQPCSPISDVRWQTEDYDGNKILLQVQGACWRNREGTCYAASTGGESVSAPSTFTRTVASYKNRRHQHRVTTRPRSQQALHNSLPLASEEQNEQEEWSDQHFPDQRKSQWRAQQSGSHFSLPNLGSTTSFSTCNAPAPSSSRHNRNCTLNRRPSLVPPFHLNVDSLIGAEETDVDTGNKVNPGSTADLSVISAYIKSSLPLTPRPLSAPPEDVRPAFSPDIPDNTYKSATLGRTINCGPSSLLGTHLQSSSLSTSAAPSSSDVSIDLSDSCSIISAPTEEADRLEEEQEFYI